MATSQISRSARSVGTDLAKITSMFRVFKDLRNFTAAAGAILSALSIVWSLPSSAQNLSCNALFAPVGLSQPSSYNQVLAQMKKEPYDYDHLPVQPITLFRMFGKSLLPRFNVATRSREILNDKRDFREVGEPKPIHPMGVGFEGRLKMLPSRWSGVFSGGEYPVLARASISQGNPYKSTASGQPQTRTAAIAIKIYGEANTDKPQPTANIVFNNDLNGILSSDGSPIDWTSVAMTNQPTFNALKIRKAYEVLTLIGVAYGSLTTQLDRLRNLPFINPLLRPVHSMSELGVKSAKDIRTPVWVMLKPSRDMKRVVGDDFRQELVETTKANGALIYDFFASDKLDALSHRVWEKVGELTLVNPMLSRGVDQNILFPHDSLKSAVTGLPLSMPIPDKNNIPLPDDVQ